MIRKYGHAPMQFRSSGIGRGVRHRFRKMAKHQALVQQERHVVAKRPMPSLDADAMPVNPLGALLRIAIDEEALGAVGTFHPGCGLAGGVEARQICDKERAALFQNPRHLHNPRLDMRDVNH
jgi:hypothetical protein